jgi:hypothetical protein
LAFIFIFGFPITHYVATNKTSAPAFQDAVDPNGIISAGRYGIWPKHRRGTKAWGSSFF